jgi:hypothetical protein
MAMMEPGLTLIGGCFVAMNGVVPGAKPSTKTYETIEERNRQSIGVLEGREVESVLDVKSGEVKSV